jgi:hypothetical protein
LIPANFATASTRVCASRRSIDDLSSVATRRGSDPQAIRDLLVSKTGGHELQDLALACGEAVVRRS